MGASEELRRMLDERGVEYDTRDGNAIKNTYWNDGNGRRWGYTEDASESGMTTPTLFLVSGQLTFTPEQAIAATLGNMSATVDDVLSLLDEMNGQGRIEYADYSQLHDAIAATLGGGECEVVSSRFDDMMSEWCIELSCGHAVWDRTEPPNYCCECGARIRKAVER